MSENANDVAATQTLDNVLAAILREADAGASVNRDEWLSRYPQFAEALAEFFAEDERLGRWTAPLREVAHSTQSDAVTIGMESSAGAAPGVAGPAGRSFGDYEILEEIGQGGMGIVYRARQRRLNRLVALKMVRAGEFASQADRLRFFNEAEVVGQMDHPHIVPIYEVGDAHGQHFFSMKLVAGPSLAGWIAECRAKPAALMHAQQRQIARLIATVAHAVHHAHQRGILHRDLKPGNILLAPIGDDREAKTSIGDLQAAIPMVTDFGLAKRVEEAPATVGIGGAATHEPITQSGAIVGTPAYMAPEQAAASKGQSTAVDTYSLGAILFELLTGRPPFQAATALDTLLQVLHQEPARPRKLNPAIDSDLETICLKCLEKEPTRRYGSAEELARDLERWLCAEPIQARRAGCVERVVKWSKRRPAAASAFAIGLASLAALLTAGIFLWQNAEARAAAVKSLDDAQGKIANAEGELKQKEEAIKEKTTELERLQHRAQEEGARAEQARDRGDAILYDADMRFAHAAWQNDDVPGMTRLLKLHEPKPGDKDRRGFEWRYLWRLAQGDGFLLRAHVAPERALAAPLDKVVGDVPSATFHPVLTTLSPDGKLLASVGGDQLIRLWQMDNGNVIRTVAGAQSAVSLGFSLDGKGLVVVRLKPADKGAFPPPAFAGALGGKASLKGLSETLLVQFVSLDGKAGEEMPFQPLALGANLRAAGVTAPVNLMASPEGMMAMVGAMVPLQAREMFGPMCLALDPEKRTFAMGGVITTIPVPDPTKPPAVHQEGAILIWDVTADRPRKVIRGESSMVSTLAFAPDGRTLASAAFDLSVKLWDTRTYDVRGVLKGSATPVFSLAFSAKSSQLVAGALDGVVKMWDLNDTSTPTTFKGHINSVSSVCVAPDGRTVVAGCVDGTIRSWGTRHSVPQQFRTDVMALAFSPDGKQLAGIDRDGTLKRIDPVTGKAEDGKLAFANQLRPSAVFAPDGQSLVLMERVPNRVRVVAVPGGEERLEVQPNLVVSAACVTHDGTMLALGCWDKTVNWQIQLWNVPERRLERTFQGGSGVIKGLTFSRDGKMLVGGGSDKTIRVWDPTTGLERLGIPGDAAVTGLVLSPDEKQIAVAEGTNVRVLNLATGKASFELPGSMMVHTMAFSPDGRRLATAGGDAELGRGFGIKLWDMTTGREVLNLAGPTQVVTQVAFSPDGDRLAAAIGGETTTGPIYSITRPSEVQIWHAR
jgi:serine/threonine protein kinase/WD40 repeat protein